MSEPGFDPRSARPNAPACKRRRMVELASLPPDRYPCLVESATWLTACDPEFHYRFGVGLFAAGVEATATRNAAG